MGGRLLDSEFGLQNFEGYCLVPWHCRKSSTSISLPRDMLFRSIPLLLKFWTVELGDTLGCASQCSFRSSLLLLTMLSTSSLASESFLFPSHSKRLARIIMAGLSGESTWSPGMLRPISTNINSFMRVFGDSIIRFKRTALSFVPRASLLARLIMTSEVFFLITSKSDLHTTKT